jgi:hypothetical protein
MRPLNREPSVVVSSAIPYTMREKLVELARRDDVPMSEEVRRALGLLFAAQATEPGERDFVSAA